MKKIIVLFLAVTFLASCNVAKQVSAYAKKHCNQESAFNYQTGKVEITYHCDSLFKTPFVSDKCSAATLCIDVATGSVWGVADCDSAYDLSKVIASLKKK